MKLVGHRVFLVDVVVDGVGLVLHDGEAVDADDGKPDDDVEQGEEELDRQGHPLPILPHPVYEEERLEHLPGRLARLHGLEREPAEVLRGIDDGDTV